MENNTIFGRNITIGGITVDTKIKWTKDNNKEINCLNIQNRYDLYNEWFYEVHKQGEN